MRDDSARHLRRPADLLLEPGPGPAPVDDGGDGGALETVRRSRLRRRRETLGTYVRWLKYASLRVLADQVRQCTLYNYTSVISAGAQNTILPT